MLMFFFFFFFDAQAPRGTLAGQPKLKQTYATGDLCSPSDCWFFFFFFLDKLAVEKEQSNLAYGAGTRSEFKTWPPCCSLKTKDDLLTPFFFFFVQAAKGNATEL